MPDLNKHRSVEYEREMKYTPPKGTKFHCVKECQKKQAEMPEKWNPLDFDWKTRKPGVPRRCGTCKSPYYDVFPEGYDPLADRCTTCKRIWYDEHSQIASRPKAV